ncbi:hypothetical protein M758_8G070200 [Ceratodon purpureus]|nr:hypothetical protein M758_8G070200 [Ceratodon purpureus]
MSFLVRQRCLFVSRPLCGILRLPRCASFCSSPKWGEGVVTPSFVMTDEKMKRRPFRKVEMRAVQSEAELLEETPIGVKDEETLVRMWQGFGRTEEVPVLVKKLMENTKALEAELGEELKFGGPRGSLKGEAGKTEDRRHRAFYHTLSDSESKLQFFAARQVACRILGSHGYLCEHCWLPTQDCMCEALVKGSLWQNMRLWVYMHPKDFLRKNNTGKLLWQALGDQVQLCVCGIPLHEDAMWAALQQAGRDHVWCVYPAKNEHEITVSKLSAPQGYNEEARETTEDCQLQPLNFIMIDGTWSNSKAMVSRLQERASAVWEGRGMPCLALSPDEFSSIHGLRPQPSMEKTCTAAAAGQLLRELNQTSAFAGHDLDLTADTIDEAVDCLSEALVGRRRRVGRPVTRSRRRDYQSN